MGIIGIILLSYIVHMKTVPRLAAAILNLMKWLKYDLCGELVANSRNAQKVNRINLRTSIMRKQARIINDIKRFYYNMFL